MAKKRIGSCLLVAVAGLMWSRLAGADDVSLLMPQKRTLSLGVTAGVFLPDRDVHDFYWTTNTWQPLNSVAPAMGLRVAYDPIQYLGVELEGELIPTGTVNGDSATMHGWRTQVLGQLPGRLTPFVSLGLGSMGLISGDGVLGDDSDFTWHAGLGGKLYLTPRWSVRLDGRWLIAPKLDLVAQDDSMVNHFLVTTSLSWNWQIPSRQARVEFEIDADHDGVIGRDDKCEHEAGVAPDGCPAVADTDQDGLLDNVDKCPSEPEVLNEVDDEDGCPDAEPDQDGDKVANRDDRCVDAAEDLDGFEDTDGCPDTDNDKDGILDAQDGCASTAGPADNHGCPDKDADNDSVVDRFDNCPNEPGWQQFRGCRKNQLVVITPTDIKVLENIYFASKKATIRARSNPLLDNLVQVLNAHPEITRVTIEGHTDNRGEETRNKELSHSRARAVIDYLVVNGVSADRLEAVGVGEERPIANNKTSSGRAQNRRVEFHIERKPMASNRP